MCVHVFVGASTARKSAVPLHLQLPELSSILWGFSLVAILESIRILIAIAAQVNQGLHHLDVKTGFLNGEIDEDIYITKLEGAQIKGNKDYALNLQKDLEWPKTSSESL